MGINDVFNIINVDERITTAGQPTEEQLKSIKEDGFQTVINLAPFDPKFSLPDEEKIVQSLGMGYHNIPVQWDAPVPDDYDKFLAIMRDTLDKKIFIHCVANYRVTAFYSLYAMQNHEWLKQKADDFMKQIWESNPELYMNDIWKKFIQQIRKNISSMKYPLFKVL